MLHLDVLHGVHGIGAVHAGVVRMEKKHDGAGGGPRTGKIQGAPGLLSECLLHGEFQ